MDSKQSRSEPLIPCLRVAAYVGVQPASHFSGLFGFLMLPRPDFCQIVWSRASQGWGGTRTVRADSAMASIAASRLITCV